MHHTEQMVRLTFRTDWFRSSAKSQQPAAAAAHSLSYSHFQFHSGPCCPFKWHQAFEPGWLWKSARADSQRAREAPRGAPASCQNSCDAAIKMSRTPLGLLLFHSLEPAYTRGIYLCAAVITAFMYEDMGISINKYTHCAACFHTRFHDVRAALSKASETGWDKSQIYAALNAINEHSCMKAYKHMWIEIEKQIVWWNRNAGFMFRVFNISDCL